MSAPFGWANRPMIERISQLRQDTPISFVYGARSWIDSSSGYKIRELRENSFVEIKLIQGAGHHVYADKADEFNEVVSKICKTVDLRGISTSREKSTDISNAALTVDDFEDETILAKSV
ncbi:1-acylglycerol-3-phosphate O-acyltransferase ABHD5 [Araneus ventricosus]|uniref:1-acylglycerol-3-phosphate O-acyltransferase ABHD5 n=1 Tax=Araneus ventricosus TaxID=182803 RepID=A0A4Y2G045_ARAVE|nr:1-acylglycerol-3-phosphate O-acyltransferase ABHD5 [Araneus ventricosus]